MHSKFWVETQFWAYLWRPQAYIHQRIAEKRAKLGWTHPIIGIHVRRGDKVPSILLVVAVF